MPSPVAGPPDRPLAIAHRGGALLAAENTAAAFTRAAAIGADWVETDLRRSRDGSLVCLHDADLLRLAGDPRRVAETDLATLRLLVPGLMTLPEAIAASAPLGLLLDVKTADPALFSEILAALEEGGARRRAVLGLRDLGQIAMAGSSACWPIRTVPRPPAGPAPPGSGSGRARPAPGASQPPERWG